MFRNVRNKFELCGPYLLLGMTSRCLVLQKVGQVLTRLINGSNSQLPVSYLPTVPQNAVKPHKNSTNRMQFHRTKNEHGWTTWRACPQGFRQVMNAASSVPVLHRERWRANVLRGVSRFAPAWNVFSPKPTDIHGNGPWILKTCPFPIIFHWFCSGIDNSPLRTVRRTWRRLRESRTVPRKYMKISRKKNDSNS